MVMKNIFWTREKKGDIIYPIMEQCFRCSGRSFSKEGKKAKIVKGRAKASEKANIVTMGTQNSPAVERIRTLPTIGPVQENDG